MRRDMRLIVGLLCRSLSGETLRERLLVGEHRVAEELLMLELPLIEWRRKMPLSVELTYCDVTGPRRAADARWVAEQLSLELHELTEFGRNSITNASVVPGGRGTRCKLVA